MNEGLESVGYAPEEMDISSSLKSLKNEVDIYKSKNESKEKSSQVEIPSEKLFTAKGLELIQEMKRYGKVELDGYLTSTTIKKGLNQVKVVYDKGSNVVRFTQINDYEGYPINHFFDNTDISIYHTSQLKTLKILVDMGLANDVPGIESKIRRDSEFDLYEDLIEEGRDKRRKKFKKQAPLIEKNKKERKTKII